MLRFVDPADCRSYIEPCFEKIIPDVNEGCSKLGDTVGMCMWQKVILGETKVRT